MSADLSTFYKKINLVFEQVIKMLHLALTYPITSNVAERSFSKLKLLLSPLRSRMGNQKLNYLALMSTHKDCLSKISTKFVIEKFKENPRKAHFIQKAKAGIYILTSNLKRFRSFPENVSAFFPGLFPAFLRYDSGIRPKKHQKQNGKNGNIFRKKSGIF